MDQGTLLSPHNASQAPWWKFGYRFEPKPKIVYH